MAEAAELTAGQALDVAIAERLFGYTLDWEGADESLGLRPLVNELTTGGRVWTDLGWEGHADVEPLPEFSTTWEGLGLVVEAMRERGWLIDVEYYECGEWCVTFWRGSDRKHWRLAPTAPEAACRAALAALGG